MLERRNALGIFLLLFACFTASILATGCSSYFCGAGAAARVLMELVFLSTHCWLWTFSNGSLVEATGKQVINGE